MRMIKESIKHLFLTVFRRANTRVDDVSNADAGVLRIRGAVKQKKCVFWGQSYIIHTKRLCVIEKKAFIKREY